ncbi:MAG: PilZ domain-containing protein [Planctomycetota bacterium]|nr:MAG: PilZ domain-containing protein [Planctomycetota bacterium]
MATITTSSKHDPPVVEAPPPVEDRRSAPRLRVRSPLHLVPLPEREPLACRAADISPGGVFVRMPKTCAPAVGQRVELHFPDRAVADIPTALAGLRCYATVVRTQRMGDDPTADLGAALRFDQPVYL